MNIDYPNQHQIKGLRRLWHEAFGDSGAFMDAFFDTAYSPRRALCATISDEVVASMYWFLCECRGKKIAYIYAVATANEYRGRGICRELMAQAHKILKDEGYVGAVLVPGEKSLFEFYSKMGYEICSHIKEWECDADATACKVDEISIAKYTELRRQYLPDGAVIQEGEGIEFLSQQLQFYCGDGFVMTATVLDGILYCAEILGDTEKVSQIVLGMGARLGRFRGVGTDKPFAMYKSLDNGDTPPPIYFGLAFD